MQCCDVFRTRGTRPTGMEAGLGLNLSGYLVQAKYSTPQIGVRLARVAGYRN
jgi:hypothetical protein